MKITIALIWGLLAITNLRAQNLFDATNSFQFAQYLQQGGQFNLAAIEFERLVFMLPEKDSLKVNLLDCYLLDRNFEAVHRRALQFQPQNNDARSIFHSYASFALLSNQQYETATLFLNSQNSLTDSGKYYYQAWSLILQDQYKEAQTIVEKFKNNKAFFGLQAVQEESLKLPRKSPFVAGLLSTLVPGSGKWYAHERKDAIIGFLSIAALSYQAYRGFRKDGQKSVYGWISAGLGAGFYLGNIYGSAKSAKRFNKRQYAKLRPSIEKNFTIYR
jgi:hypothetical protein